ncbi:MAG: hypothetical protein JJE23_11770 [Thermoleophilia bacterium]|nr:hypothetical protein [Thermoleophilia bacterium]
MLIDELLPAYDVSDSVATTVGADRQTTWEALLGVDLIEVGRLKPLIGALGAARMLPELAVHLLHGERLPQAPDRMTLVDTTEALADEGGWVLLGERPGEEIALGLVGRFWRPVIEYATVEPEEFDAFDEPGWAKTVYALSARALGPASTLLEGTMRTATTDEHARRWFRRYWTFGVGSGAHVLVQGLLDVARDEAESQPRG